MRAEKHHGACQPGSRRFSPNRIRGLPATCLALLVHPGASVVDHDSQHKQDRKVTRIKQIADYYEVLAEMALGNQPPKSTGVSTNSDTLAKHQPTANYGELFVTLSWNLRSPGWSRCSPISEQPAVIGQSLISGPGAGRKRSASCSPSTRARTLRPQSLL